MPRAQRLRVGAEVRLGVGGHARDALEYQTKNSALAPPGQQLGAGVPEPESHHDENLMRPVVSPTKMISTPTRTGFPWVPLCRSLSTHVMSSVRQDRGVEGFSRGLGRKQRSRFDELR